MIELLHRNFFLRNVFTDLKDRTFFLPTQLFLRIALLCPSVSKWPNSEIEFCTENLTNVTFFVLIYFWYIVYVRARFNVVLTYIEI